MLLQPYAWFEFFQALPNPDEKLADPASWAYFGRANEYMANGSAFQVWWGNLTNGKIGVIRWSWENGRVFQIPALFMLGMLAGRKGAFKLSPENKRFWGRTLVIAAMAFVPFYLLKSYPGAWSIGEALQRPLLVIVTSWSNVAFMVVLASSFVLLFYSWGWLAFLSPLAG